MKIRIYCFTLFFALTLVKANSQTILVLHPSEDAQVGFHDGNNAANQNAGTAGYYGSFWQPAASGSGENGGRGLMKFDLSNFSSGSEIISAHLDLYGRGPYGAGDAVQYGHYGADASYLQRITSSWAEMVATWNTQPTYTTINEVSLPASTSAIQDYLNIDVTQLIKDLIDSTGSNFGICIRLQNESITRSLAFCSKDFSDTTKFPTLSIVYSTCEQTEVISFSPSEDAQVGFHDGNNAANQNAGTAGYYGTFWQPAASGSGENGGRGLMKFDLSNFSSGSEIISAHLDLYGRGPYGAGDAVQYGHYGADASYLQRITSSWSEMVATWNTQPAYTTINEVSLSTSTSATQDYLNVDVTQLVKDLIDSSGSNFGICIRLQNESITRSLAFCSTDFNDSTKWPLLTITSCKDNSAINDIKNEEHNLIVYPNPFSNESVLIIQAENFNKENHLVLYDLLGREVKKINYSSASLNLNVSDLDAGIYFLKITSSDLKVNYDIQKIVKQ